MSRKNPVILRLSMAAVAIVAIGIAVLSIHQSRSHSGMIVNPPVGPARVAKHAPFESPTSAQLRQWGISLRPYPHTVPVSLSRAKGVAISTLPFKMTSYKLGTVKLVTFQHLPNFSTPAWFLVYRNVTAIRGATPRLHTAHYRWASVFIDALSGKVLEVLTER